MNEDITTSTELTTSTNTTYLDAIPLTDTLISNHLNTLYIYLTMIRNQATKIRWSVSGDEKIPNTVSIELNDNYAVSRSLIGMHRNNFNPAAKSIPLNQKFNDDFITLMPIDVWDRFFEFVSTKPMKSRNAWTKLYCLIYHNAVKFASKGGFVHSIENIQKLVGSADHADISKRLKELEAAGFIVRSEYNVQLHWARRYSIPEEQQYFGLEERKRRNKQNR